MSIRTVPFTPTGCVLHRSHRPRPSRLEKHHVLPLYLQKRLGVDVNNIVLMCADGHIDVHVAINALLVQAPNPRGIGTAERKYARLALVLFVENGGSAPL